ncbi:MAG: metalloregulator ArsR/SmtB family transcription factor [Deltaproteobacteria bacterium]|nr:metalloregulator ArsR/SmtB family transcription factor [Deltaproteobacteria bacterium]
MTLLQTYKALADVSRLRLLRTLLSGRFSVNELVEIVAMGQSRVSRHLKLLCDAGLARVDREGTWAYYQAAAEDDADTAALLALVQRRSEELPQAAEDQRRRQRCLEARRTRARRFHDQVAPRWSQLRRELLGNGVMSERILARLERSAVVADLGCGAGEMLLPLARQARQVIGIDSSPAMLDQAQQALDGAGRGAQRPARRVELRLGTLEHLPLADGEASAALLNLVLHHIADPPHALREARRALAPGGTLVLCDLARHGEEWMRDRYGDLWLGFSPAELERLLAQAGFRSIEIERYDESPRAGILLAVAHAPRKGAHP